MPIYRNRTIIDIARGIKAFLNLDVGLTRGAVPDTEQMLGQLQSRFEERDRQLKRTRERLSNKDRKVKQLRQRIASRKRNRAGPQARHSVYAVRKEVASRYLTGSGIEIGALHQPLDVPPNVTVRYVDIKTVDELRALFPELAEHDLVTVDIVEDGETLSSVADASVDFVIANHMLEHCQNTISTIENHLRVLKPGGIYFVSVPDKRFTFDRDRPITPLEHLVRDYEEGPMWSVNSDYEEWARLVDKIPEGNIATRVQHLVETNQNIHWHVWTQLEFLELLLYCRRDLRFEFEIELFEKSYFEVVCVLRKPTQG